MEIRKATLDDCRAVAELALMAGEGIPAYFWQESQQHHGLVILLTRPVAEE